MNTSAIEKFGDSELKELYSELGVFNITNDTNNNGIRWDEVVVKVKRRLGLDVFFNLEIKDDLRNSSIQRITVGLLFFQSVCMSVLYMFCSVLSCPISVFIYNLFCLTVDARSPTWT